MKLKPHKGVYKIPIHRHTPKRYAKSIYLVGYNWNENYGVGVNLNFGKPLVTDISRVPTTSVDFSTGEELTAFMTSEFRKVGFEPYPPKPSLWQRIKRKVKQ